MIRINPRKIFWALLLGSMLPAAALAHETSKGPNGGQLIEVEGHHVEFLATESDLIFLLTDEKEAPIASAGAKMKAIVQDAGSKSQIELSPAEPNKLVGKTTAPLSPGAKVVITGTLPDGHTLQGRFVVPKTGTKS